MDLWAWSTASVSVEGLQYSIEHLTDAFIPRLSHKSTMEPLTQTTWDFYLNSNCTKAAVSGSVTPRAKSAI